MYEELVRILTMFNIKYKLFKVITNNAANNGIMKDLLIEVAKRRELQ